MNEFPTCSTETALPSPSKRPSIWAWIKSLFATSTRPQPEPIEHRLIALLEKQHATLDRVVQAKFDVPMRVTAPPQQSAPMLPPYMLSDVLSTESDAEFLSQTDSLSN
jgi:hypothetical protein